MWVLELNLLLLFYSGAGFIVGSFSRGFPSIGLYSGLLVPGRYWAHPSKFLVTFGPLPLTGLVSKSQHFMEGFWSFCTSVIIWSVASADHELIAAKKLRNHCNKYRNKRYA